MPGEGVPGSSYLQGCTPAQPNTAPVGRGQHDAAVPGFHPARLCLPLSERRRTRPGLGCPRSPCPTTLGHSELQTRVLGLSGSGVRNRSQGPQIPDNSRAGRGVGPGTPALPPQARADPAANDPVSRCPSCRRRVAASARPAQSMMGVTSRVRSRGGGTPPTSPSFPGLRVPPATTPRASFRPVARSCTGSRRQRKL